MLTDLTQVDEPSGEGVVTVVNQYFLASYGTTDFWSSFAKKTHFTWGSL